MGSGEEKSYASTLPADTEEAEVTNTRLTSLSQLAHCPLLRKLSARENQLKTLDGLDLFVHLEHLDLYLNELTELGSHLSGLFKLRWLDLSFNSLRSIEGLEAQAKSLEELYLIQNKLSEVPKVSHLVKLRILELGANRIRSVEESDVENLPPSLEELWLGKNKITKVSGLERIAPTLRRLDLQSNRLVDLGTSLLSLVNLEELYLSHQGLSTTKGLHTLVNLRILDLSANSITIVEDLENLVKLEELWLGENKIAEFTTLETLRGATGLATLYLERNPLESSSEYVPKLRALFPSLTQLDSHFF